MLFSSIIKIMKKVTTLCVLCFGLFVAGIFIGSKLTKNEYLRRSKEIAEKDIFTNQDIEHILFNTPLQWENYAKELREIGYSEKAAEHIAKVELNYLPIDEEYNSLIQN